MAIEPVKGAPRPRIVGALGPRHAAELPSVPQKKQFCAHHLAINYAVSVHPPVLEACGPDGSFLLIDGEVYNSDELLGFAEDHAAAILEAYRRHGSSIFAKLDLSASVVLWDAPAQELIVLRDFMGHVPVFVAQAGDSFLFASDLPALLDAGVPRDMDPAALDFYLARGFVPAPMTFFKDIRRLPPGTLVRVKSCGAPRFERYWQRTGAPVLDLDVEGVVEEYARLIPRAVKRRLAGNPGVLLSGGVDSKTLLALACAQSETPVPAFTFRYLDYDGEFNETGLAKACADQFGSPHTEIPVDPHEIAARLPEMLFNFGEPFSYGLHSVMLGKVRDHGITNLLAGTGADSLHVIWQERNALRVKKWPAIVRAALGPPAARLRGAPLIGTQMSELHGALWSARTGLPHFVSAYMMPTAMRAMLYTDPQILARGRSVWNDLRNAALLEYSGESDITRYKFITQRYFGTEMMGNWNHWASRAHGLMVRSVYFDHELLERVSRIPLTRANKLELREYASRLMPRDMAYAKKLPQSAPIEVWTRGPLREFVMDSLTPARVQRYALFAPKTVERLIERHMSGQKDYGWQLWSLISVMAWQDVFKAGAAGETQ